MDLDLRHVAKRVAYAIDDLTMSERGTVVLAYHRVGGQTDSPVDLPTHLFRRQMAHLAASADVVDLDTALESLTDARSPAEPQVVLTFDDGTSDFVDIALPILADYGLPATLYVATEHLDSGRPFPGDGTPLSWAAVADIASSGLVDIGAHTHTHALLDRVDETTAALEFDLCDERIADAVGRRPAHFAYPKAVGGSPAVDALVRKRYRSAAVAGTRPNLPGQTDAHRLARSPIQRSDGWEGFVRKREGGMRAEDDVRVLLNRVRYRAARS